MGREGCFQFGSLGDSSIDIVQKLLSRLVFFDLAYLMEFGRGDQRSTWRNNEEIFFVIALLSQLNYAVAKTQAKEGNSFRQVLNKEALSKLTIGIVVPFPELVARYEGLISERLLHKFDISKITVGLPKAFRGQEKDILIVSSFRNSADQGFGAFKSKEHGSLDESELLMTFTRARKFLWCVGSLETLEATGSVPLRQLAAFVRKSA